MSRDGEGRLIYIAAGLIAPIVLGMLLVPLRDRTTASNLAFAFLALTIVVAEFGGSWAALVAAITSALSLDFFLTQPYMRLTIAGKHDVIAFMGLGACGLIAAACGSDRARTTFALRIAQRDRQLLRRSLRKLEEAGSTEDAITSILDAVLNALPVSAAVVRDERGEIVALSGSAHELSAAGKLLRSDTLLPLDGSPSHLPRAGRSLPVGGGRLPLRESNRLVGSLDLWGTGSSADAEARRTLSDVGRVLAALLARKLHCCERV